MQMLEENMGGAEGAALRERDTHTVVIVWVSGVVTCSRGSFLGSTWDETRRLC
jgi:hypothetical protein